MIFRANSRKKLAAAIILSAAISAVYGQNAPVGGGFANPNNGAAAPGGPGAPPKATPYTLSGVYTLSGKTVKSKDTTYTSDAKDMSAIYVKSSGDLTLTNATVTTTADSSSTDNSSFYGLNAAVLATHGCKIKMTGGNVTTAGSGANCVFATGSGATITLTGTTLNGIGEGAHGVMATVGGNVTLADVTISTTGGHAAAIATDRGGGTINVTGGNFNTSGEKSPAIYSTGIIKVTGAIMTATGAEAAVVEGKNSITLTDTTLTGQKSRGVMIYQSLSGDAEAAGGGSGNFTMTHGSLTAGDGPLFYVTNTNAGITLSGVTLNASGGTLIDASAGEWGKAGFNGGHVIFTADHETLNGDLTADSQSSIAAKLEDNTNLTGTVKNAALSLDSTSTWNVSADSTVTVLLDSTEISRKIVRNIIGNGHFVTYDSMLSANKYLGGRTYALAMGGQLIPSVKNNTANGNGRNNGYGGANGGANGGNAGGNNGGGGGTGGGFGGGRGHR